MTRIIFVLLISSLAVGDNSVVQQSRQCFISLKNRNFPGFPKRDAVAAIAAGDYRYLGILGWPGAYVPAIDERWGKTPEMCVIDDFTTCIITDDPEENMFRDAVFRYAEEYNTVIHGVRLKWQNGNVPANKSLQRTRPRAARYARRPAARR
jgi:hypothetical protein